MKRHAITPAIAAALCLGFATCAAHADSFVYIGTRGIPRTAAEQAQNTGSAQGIYAARFDTNTGKLTPLGLQAELARASWLVTHPALPVVYSIARAPDGAEAVAAGRKESDANIHSFKVDKASGKLQPLNQMASGALYTTHMTLDGKSSTLFGAGFESGDVTALPIRADGSLGPLASSQKNYGTGPHARQKSPHPHAVTVDLAGRYVLSPDLGADRIFVYRFDPATRALTPAQTPFEQLPAGSAPRHSAFHPSGKFFFMNTELTAEVRSYSWDAQQGRLQLVQAMSAYPAGYTGNDKSSAEVAFSSDGKFFYVGLRGDQNSVVVYEVSTDGRFKEIQRIASQGQRPWSFGIDPTGRWMLVTNEASNMVNVLSIDKATGKLTPTNQSLSVPNPAALAFVAN